MKRWAALLLSVILAGCASAPPMPPIAPLLNDGLFAAPSEPISARDVFALSDDMKRYLSTEIADELRAKGRQQGLFDALYSRSQLKIEYDSVTTRNAAQTFAARAGNCLSLVIMTAAFAKELGLGVRYQSVYVDETWGRSGDLYLSIGHVNLVLARKITDAGLARNESEQMTIDFLPPRDIRAVRTRAIGEDTIVAMYMNNRAVESLARGRVDDAYWWARAAIGQDSGFLSSYNTLGVVYQRHGNLDEARRVLALALEREPENTQVMSNLAAVLRSQGRVAESGSLTRKLEQLEPEPPFRYFNLGQAAMRNGDFKAAKEFFAKEVERAGYYHEFHFWLALAHASLGETEQARKHLAIAIENSTTRKDHDLYAAKLERIKKSSQSQ